MIFLNSYFKLIAIILLVSCSTLVYGQYGWVKEYKLQDSSSYFYDVTPTQDGGYFLAGSIGENIPGGPGSTGSTHYPLLIRLDVDGDVVWQRVYRTLNSSKIWAVRELPNGGAVFILGGYNAEAVGTTANGTIDWTQTYTGSPTSSFPSFISGGIETTSDGNYLIHDTNSSVFKISPSGTLLWTVETGNAVANGTYLSPHGHNVTEVGSDSFVIIGAEEINFGTGIMQMVATLIDGTGVLKREILAPSNMEGYAGIKTNDQLFLFCGNTSAAANDTLTLVKTDADLNEIWTKKHLLSITPIDIWNIQEVDNGNIWCLASDGDTGGGGMPSFVYIYVFNSNGDYVKKIDISAEIKTTKVEHITFAQFGLSIDNPRTQLIKSGDGHIVIGLSYYDINSMDYGMAHIKIDTSGQIRPTLEGRIFGDYNLDCAFNAGDLSLEGWTVRATRASDGLMLYGTSDPDGRYEIQVDSGTFIVELSSLGLAYWQPCVLSPQVIFNGQYREEVNFALEDMITCPLVQVDISAPFLRTTGGGSAYNISSCNMGTSLSANTNIEVEIDPFLTVLSTSIPIVSQSGNVYTFNVGNISVGACRNFEIQVLVDTTAQLGQTHCSEAHAYPDSVCIPNYWSAPVIEVDGNCQNDTVFFEITNTGTNMGNTLEYYVFEDHVMMRQASFQLNNGGIEVVAQAALPGKTYRLSAEQQAGFPALIGDILAIKVVEGCVLNANGSFNTGFVNQFSNGSISPFISVDCQANVAAYDPNDKSAQPEGYQSQHYIEASTVLDYKIRFQNTGTDTAFYVIIKDTLSPYLDPSSIQMGASSHAYTWTLLDNGVLKVSFPDIKLVDSIANEPLSHGFFRYKIHQQPNNPIGTVINNRAAIYFDYNPPIITNTTFHTIDKNFITIILSTEEIDQNGIDIKVYPNPFKDFTTLEVQGKDYATLTLSVYDLSGRIIQTLHGQNTSSMKIYRQDLPQGVYIYQLEGDGQRISTGKIMVQGN